MKKRILSLVAGSCLFLTWKANALVETGFEGYSATELHGQNIQEEGWSNLPWSGTDTGGRFSIIDTSSNPLTYGSDNGGSRAYQLGVPGGNDTIMGWRAFETPIGGNEVYFSFLMRTTSNSPSSSFGGFWLVLTADDGTPNGIYAGIRPVNAGDFRLFGSVQGSTSSYQDYAVYADQSIVLETTHLVVGRLSKQNSATFFDQINLWLNPSSSTLGVPDVTAGGSIANPHSYIQAIGGLEFGSYGFDATSYGLKTEFDNIRFSETLEDVLGAVTAPPATWAGYEITGTVNVNTEDWLGWIDIANTPWIYLWSINSWVYMPEEAVLEAGAWGYISK